MPSSLRRRPAVSLAAGLLVILAATNVNAHPDLWTSASCDAHPTTAKKGHGAPKTDSTIVFAVAQAGTAKTALCAGQTYTVTVSWGTSSREALLTASQGSLGGGSTCPNKKTYLSAAKTQTATLTVPASATGSVVLKVTSASSQFDYFHQNSATFSIDPTSCSSTTTTTTASPAPTITTTTTTASPSPSPTTASPSPSPTTSTGTTTTNTAGTGSGTTTNNNNSSSSTGTAGTNTDATTTDTSSSAGTTTTTSSTTDTSGSGSTGKACAASDLGYACSLALKSGAVLHWTPGGAAPPPNACTSSPSSLSSSSSTTSSTSSDLLVHLALSSTQAGYVSLSFAAKSGVMSPGNALIGRVDGGAAKVEAYPLDGYDLGAAVSAAAWGVQGAGVVSTSAGGTVLCFSIPASGVAGVAAGALGRRRGRALAQTTAGLGLDATALQLNWAINDSPNLVTHAAKGGLQLNAVSGASTMAAAEKEKFVQVHGALMALSWNFLLPLGLLLARHRWALNGARCIMTTAPNADGSPGDLCANNHCCAKEIWFYLHVSFQCSGLLLFLIGFIIALVKLEVEGDDLLGSPRGAHKVMGYLVAALAGLQFVVAFIRPAPGAPRRPLWNFLHHNLGRAAMALAWATVYLGVYLAHMSYEQVLASWLTPLVAVLACVLGVDGALTLVRGPLLHAVVAHAARLAKVADAEKGGAGASPAAAGANGGGGGNMLMMGKPASSYRVAPIPLTATPDGSNGMRLGVPAAAAGAAVGNGHGQPMTPPGPTAPMTPN
ncbi:hypothetical protein HYH02_009975 [Chlamydomonas schloesseri]|uniref:Cytochrome b561 domain-containing protein n=1 Tax=Chlamydomonas schloesseri TaxID=2026947 RepID=A0A835W6N1_9CHLO|nr:hypothetical protein HYH02_009975 [Chlamydomonas schloesseri]|eukprot:KAG2441385.1 hypothetical protein HYH02_009975 [Chlamydomonas schloesseri]